MNLLGSENVTSTPLSTNKTIQSFTLFPLTTETLITKQARRRNIPQRQKDYLSGRFQYQVECAKDTFPSAGPT